MTEKKRIAILALQGAFVEHEQMLARLGVESFQIRKLADWDQPKDGLIIPGGESTTQQKLLRDLNLLDIIRDAILKGLPVFGTCAGLILLAKKVEGEHANGLSTMDMDVSRNAYGRQLGSFYVEASVAEVGDQIPMTFIRAPLYQSVVERLCPCPGTSRWTYRCGSPGESAGYGLSSRIE
jgi:5'-phosphate synthase pdxT subunit